MVGARNVTSDVNGSEEETGTVHNKVKVTSDANGSEEETGTVHSKVKVTSDANGSEEETGTVHNKVKFAYFSSFFGMELLIRIFFFDPDHSF